MKKSHKNKLLTVIFISISLSFTAFSDDGTRVFAIDEQPLKSALKAYAEQADVQLMYSPQVLPDKIRTSLKGSYSREDALKLLIQNTNLEFVFQGTTVVIREQQKVMGEQISPPIALIKPQPDGPRVIEEFIVTAQKREERLQDVPISILLAKGEDLQSAGINRLESLAPLMPGFHFSEAVAANDQLFMRGLGSGVNFGFENAVGQVIDDFYYGRSRFGRAAFLDIERVEILKGPQGALIGKNTTAGAINITSKVPTETFEAWISGSYEFEADRGYTLEGAISGPLTNSILGRLAIRFDDHDGWTHNSVTGADSQSTDDVTARLSLAWNPDSDFNAMVRYFKGDFDREGRAREIAHCGQPLLDFIQAKGIGEDCKANLKRVAVGIRNGISDFQDFKTEFDTLGITANWEFPKGLLTSLTGYARYEVKDEIATGLLPLELINVDATEKWTQWTQELRFSSITGDPFDYILGLYFLQIDQRSGLDVHFPDELPAEVATRVIDTRQDGYNIAVFGQLTWHINDSWSATLGARYTKEREDAQSLQFPAELYTRIPTTVNSGSALGQHNVSQDRDEDNFSPSLIFQWQPDNTAMFYGSIRQGFKGGGFDHQLVGDQTEAAQNFQFSKEQVIAYELGSKLTLAGGSTQINLAIFRNEFDDLQVSSVQDDVSFRVGNAASAITQGLELDARWRPTENLSLSWSLAYLDARYDKFPNAPCNDTQIINLSPECSFALSTRGVQDLSGKQLQFAPDWSASASAEYRWPLFNGMEILGAVQLYYSDAIALALNLDPHTIQKEYTKIDARLTFRHTNKDWEVSIIGRNLTDEITSNFANDISNEIGEGSYFRLVESPRAVAIRVLLKF